MIVSACGRVAAFIALIALAQPASGQTIAETMHRWGLTGTWAIDCSQPPSRQNGYLSYVPKTGGGVSHRRDFGGGQADAFDIEWATIGADGMIELIVHFHSFSQTRKWSMMKASDGRTKTMVNSRTDSTDYSIRNGRFVQSGDDVPWQTRCR